MELPALEEGLTYMDRRFWFGVLMGVGAGVALTLGCGFIVYKRVGLFSNSPEEKAAWVIRRLGHELNLESKQITHLNNIKDELMARRNTSDKQREDANRRILAQLESDRMDANELNKVFDERMAASREMRLLLLTRMSEFHATLNKDQRDALCRKAEHFLKTHGTPPL